MRPTPLSLIALPPIALSLLAAPGLGQTVDLTRPTASQAPAPRPARAETRRGTPAGAPPTLEVLRAKAHGTARGGEVHSAPAELDDAIPRPAAVSGAPTGPSTAEGDVPALAGPGADPFFLGFAAGAQHPPAAERVDPDLLQAAANLAQDGRPSSETYAFVMFQRRITDARLAALEELGCRVLGFHPHYAVKIALPAGRTDEVAGLDFVRWVGVAEPWQKIHPDLAPALAAAAPDAPLEVLVSTFESDLHPGSVPAGAPAGLQAGAGLLDPLPADPGVRSRTWRSNGWQQRTLEAHGAEVDWFVEGAHTFRVRTTAAGVDELAGLDFVQFIEPRAVPVPAAPHDESTTMVLGDRGRAAYDGSTNLAAIVGIMDSGLASLHADLDFWGLGWDCTGSSGGAFADSLGHGSHVMSSILGRGVAEDDQRGMAPGLASWPDGRLYALRIFGDNPCSWSLAQQLNVFRVSSLGIPIPHVVNCSWGSLSATAPIGSEFSCRLIDEQVFEDDQTFVFAAGNEGTGGPSTLRVEASAKNVVTVGGVLDYGLDGWGDPGVRIPESSRGPCGDGRWKPNIVAPAGVIRGVDGATTNGYASWSGTSMAAAHTTGGIAQLLDRWDYLRYSPANVASLLMASAITKDDATITFPTAGHLREYGAGRLNVYKGLYDTTSFGFLWHGAFNAPPGVYQYNDFVVADDVERLVVVMHYTEEAASAGASQALVNDFDLWLDRAPFGTAGDSGEYFNHQSSVDNTEVRIIDNPPAGQWRWKAFPDSVTSTVKMSVAVYAISDPTGPSGSGANVVTDDNCIQPGEEITVSSTATNYGYIDSARFFETYGSPFDLVSASTVLADGVVTDLTDNPSGGRDVLVGDILTGESRTATWVLRYGTEGTKTFGVRQRSDNSHHGDLAIDIYVDGTPPPLPGGLTSPSHAPGVWSTDTTVDLSWGIPTDNISGLAGYSLGVSPGAPGVPGETILIAPDQSSATANLTSSASQLYLNLRPVDHSGNWHPGAASYGPLRIDGVPPAAPTGLVSSSHTVGAVSCDTSLDFGFTPPLDVHSGIQGYAVVLDTSPSTVPAPSVTQASPSGTEHALAAGTYYLHVRARDVAGNWGPAAHSGPYPIVVPGGSNYCIAAPNSVGPGAQLGFVGTTSVAANDVLLSASGVPNTPGVFFYGTAQVATPFGDGYRCVGGATYRLYPFAHGMGNVSERQLDLTNPPQAAGQITPGSSWYFQLWYRDPAGGPNGFNLSNGLRLTFCP